MQLAIAKLIKRRFILAIHQCPHDMKDVGRQCQTASNDTVKRNRSLYLKIRRFVDHDQSTQLRPTTPFIGLFPIVLAGLTQSHVSDVAATCIWIIAIAIGTAWTAFAWWRGYRLLKAFGIRGDRDFDKRAKFAQAPEYHGSESAVKARKKRESSKRRKRRSS